MQCPLGALALLSRQMACLYGGEKPQGSFPSVRAGPALLAAAPNLGRLWLLILLAGEGRFSLLAPVACFSQLRLELQLPQ